MFASRAGQNPDVGLHRLSSSGRHLIWADKLWAVGDLPVVSFPDYFNSPLWRPRDACAGVSRCRPINDADRVQWYMSILVVCDLVLLDARRDTAAAGNLEFGV